MRTQRRNKSYFEYANLIINPLDNGENEVTYTEKSLTKGVISVPIGNMAQYEYGATINYDKIIICDKPFPKIDEYSVIWDKKDKYEVIRVSSDNNIMRIFIKKVSNEYSNIQRTTE